MRSIFLTGSLWRCFLLVGSGLVATAACGRHDADAPATKNSSAVEPIRRAVTGNLQIGPNGYKGRLCIDGVGCTEEAVGEDRGWTVAPGTYTVSAPYTSGPPMGSVTVDAAGNLTANGNLSNFFTIVGPMLVANTSKVTFEFDGSPIAFTFAGVSGASASSSEPYLVWGRTYYISSNWAWAPGREDASLSATGMGLSMKADGSDVVLDDDVKPFFELQTTPLRLRPRLANVAVDAGQYYGGVSFYGIGGAHGGSSIKLLIGRRYWLASSYSTALDREDGFFSSAPDFTIVDNGRDQPPTLSVVQSGSGRYVTPNGLTLAMNVKPVKIDFRGSEGPISIYGIGAFYPGANSTVPLLAGRRYALSTPWGKAPDRDDTGIGPNYGVYTFGVSFAGDAIVINDSETLKHLTPATGTATARVKVSSVTFTPVDFTGSLCIAGHPGCSTPGQTLEKKLMVGRRYETFTGGGQFTVRDDGTCSSGTMTVNGQTVQLSCQLVPPALTPGSVEIDANGFPGQICIDTVACIQGPGTGTRPVAPGIYSVSVPSTVGPVAGNISPIVGNLTVYADGSLSMDGPLGLSFDTSDSKLIARNAPVVFDFMEWKGALAIWEVEGFRGPSKTVKLIRNRRYAMKAYYTTGLNDLTDWLSPQGAGLTVPATGDQLILDSATADYFEKPQVGLTLKALVKEVTLKFDEYPGPLTWFEVESARGPEMKSKLLCGRRYALQAYYTWGLDGTSEAWLTRSDDGIKLAADCSELTMDTNGADRYFTQEAPLVLTAKTTRTTVAFNGYPGRLDVWEMVGGPGPTLTPKLLVGRRYGMQAGYTVGLGNNDSNLGFRGLRVEPNGSAVTPVGGLEQYFTASGTTLTARTADVTTKPAGYPGWIHWWEVGVSAHGQDTTAKMLVNRRYALQTPYVGNASTSWMVSPNPYGVSVVEDITSSAKWLELDDATREVFTQQGMILQARVSTVVVTPPAGYTSPACVADLVCASSPGTLTTNLLLNRSYTLTNGGTFTVQGSGTCSAMFVALGSGQATLQCTRDSSGTVDGIIPPEGATVTGTTSGNSRYRAICQYDSGDAPEHVYAWTPQVSGMATVSTCGQGTTFDTVAYVSTTLGSAEQVNCTDQTYACDTAAGEDNGSKFNFFAVAGTTYYIYVDGNAAGRQGAYSLTVKAPTYQGTIPPGGGLVTGVLAGEDTSEIDCPACDFQRMGLGYPEHVYLWTPAASGQVSFSTCGADTHFDSAVYIRSYSEGANVGCMDDANPEPPLSCPFGNGQPGGTKMTANVTAGTKYLVYVDSVGEIGDGGYSLTVAPACTSNAQCNDGDTCTVDTCGASGICDFGTVDPVCAESQQVTVKIETGGWMGTLCIDGGNCAGGTRTLQLSRGSHAFASLYDVDLTGSNALGTLTVNADGSIAPNSALSRYFYPPTTDAQGNKVLTAKTELVSFVFNGYPGVFTINGSQNEVRDGMTSTMYLLRGRKYSLLAPYTADVPGVPSFNAGYGVQLDTDGVLTLDPASVGHYFEQSGVGNRVLSVRVATVPIATQTYLGPLALNGMGYLSANPTMKLLIDRKYSLLTVYAAAVNPASGYNLAVKQGNDPTPTVEMLEDGADSFRVVNGTIQVKTTPVTVTPTNYSGVLGVNGIGYFPANNTLDLLVGRRYQMLSASEFTVPTSGACFPTPMAIGSGSVAIYCNAGPALTVVTVDVKRDLGATQIPISPVVLVDVYEGDLWVGSAPTNANGQAAVVLPPGSGPFRFHAEWGGAQFWSSTTPDCSPASCPNKTILVTGVEVTVQTEENVSAGPSIAVDAYTDSGSSWVAMGITDVNGVARIGLLPGQTYRFRTMRAGQAYWSAGDCTVLMGCSTALIDLGSSLCPAPIANAGRDLVVKPGDAVSLNGGESTTQEGCPITYQWRQEQGASLQLSGLDTQWPSFVVPETVQKRMIFSLVVTTTDGVASAPNLVNVIVLPSGARDLTMYGHLEANVLLPDGVGTPNQGVIRDGITPPLGTTTPELQYDTATSWDRSRTTDWIGYVFWGEEQKYHTFSAVTFQRGLVSPSGGKLENLQVEVLRGGNWTPVTDLEVLPSEEEAGTDESFRTYTLIFNGGAPADGIRIQGQPSGTDHFFSVAELRVYGTGVGTGAIQLGNEAAGTCARINMTTNVVTQERCFNEPSEQWMPIPVYGGYQFASRLDPTKCLSVPSGSFDAGSTLGVSPCDLDSAFQVWKVAPDMQKHRVELTANGLCMDVEDGQFSLGDRIIQSTCTGESRMRWMLWWADPDECWNRDSGSCGPANLCNPMECRNNICVPLGHVPLNNTVCMQEVCDPTTGAITQIPRTENNGFECDMAACGQGVCSDGQCVASPASAATCSLTPLLTCVLPKGNGLHTAVFGYRNTSPENLNVPTTGDNFLRWTGTINRPTSQSQPTWFRAADGTNGTRHAVFTEDFSQSLTWELAGQSVTATPGNTCVKGGGSCAANELNVSGGCWPLPLDSAEVAAAAIVPSDLAVTNTFSPGGTDGGFQVTGDGAAVYSIPLWTPPGHGGLSPGLALNYNSRGGNGVAGVGWSLSGLSEIRHCALDPAHEGTAAPIKFAGPQQDGSVVYCLDGKHLRPKGPQPSAEYYLENDPRLAIRITGFDGAGTVTGFEVKDGEGRTYTYGGSGNSSVLEGELIRDQQGFIYSPSTGLWRPSAARGRLGWSLAKVEDRYGNALVYTYDRTTQGGTSQYVSKIEYTSAGRPILRSVTFTYESRTDVEWQFVSGLPLTQNKRLQRVEMFGPKPTSMGLLRSYQLSYATEVSTTGRSRLRDVKECDGAGVCKKPIKFEYELGNTTFTRVPDAGFPGNGEAFGTIIIPRPVWVGDFDGDGNDDIVFRQRSGSIVDPNAPHFWAVGMSDGKKFTINEHRDLPIGQKTASTTSPFIDPVIVDLDSDGRAEFGIYDPATARFRFRSFPFGQEVGVTIGSFDLLHKTSLPAYLGDMTGDGLPDSMQIEPATKVWRFLPNLGPQPNGTISLGDPSSCGVQSGVDFTNSYFANVTGAGRLDFIFTAPNQPKMRAINVADCATRAVRPLTLKPATSKFTQPPGSRYVFLDVNGDGVSDALEYETDGNEAAVQMGIGGDYYPVPISSLATMVPADWLEAYEVIWRQTQEYPPSWLVPTGGFIPMDVDQNGHDDVLIWKQGETPRWIPLDSGVIGWVSPSRGLGGDLASDVSSGTSWFPPLVLDFNGDGLEDIAVGSSLFVRETKKPDLMTAVTDGLGSKTTIRYAPLKSAAHTPAPLGSCSYPLKCVRRGAWVVDEVTRDLATPSEPARETHKYAGAREGLGGYGWLGMASHTITNVDSGAERTVEYDNTTRLFAQDLSIRPSYAYSGHRKVDRTRVSVSAGSDRRITVETTDEPGWFPADSANSYLIRTRVHCERLYESNGTALPDPATALQRTCTTFGYDGYGNPTSAQTVTLGGETHSVTTTYDNWAGSGSLRVLGIPRRVVQNSAVPARNGLPARTGETRTIEYAPDSKGAIRTITTEPDLASSGGPLVTTQTIDRGSNGRLERVTVVGDVSAPWPQGVTQPPSPAAYQRRSQTRITTLDYENPDDDVFPFGMTNSLGQRERFIYHQGLGTMVGAVDTNGQATTIQIDGFGRLKGKAEAGRAQVSVRYQWQEDNFPLVIESIVTSGASAQGRYDKLGREVFHEAAATGGRRVRVFRRYDDRGFLRSISTPTYSTTAQAETSFTYDPAGRLLTRTDPDGVVSANLTYDALKVTALDGREKSSYRRTDDLGRVIESGNGTAENPSLVTKFDFGPFGRLDQMTIPGGRTIAMTYDRSGRRTGLVHPDSGSFTFAPNAFSELVHQMDEDGRNETRTYDPLGRLLGIDGVDGDTSFQYDSAANGVGALARSTSSSGVRVNQLFDPLGRPIGQSLTVPGIATPFTTAVDYDSLDRLTGVTYPAVGNQEPLYLLYSYSVSGPGMLQKINRYGSNLRIWQAENRSPFGSVSQEIFGNRMRVSRTIDPATGQLTHLKGGFVSAGSATFDPENPAALPGLEAALQQDIKLEYNNNRNLKTRHDLLVGLNETFDYDDADRLLYWTVEGLVPRSKFQYAYDPLGNLTGRTVLDGPGAQYDLPHQGPTGNAGPHAVTELKVGGASIGSYSYDNRGNQITGPGRNVEFTQFDLPKKITKDDGQVFTFTYDAFNQRVRRTGGGRDIIYSGKLYERREEAGAIQHIFHVHAEGREVAQVIWSELGGGGINEEVRYVHDDQVGSVEMVSSGTEEAPVHVRFDPFGKIVQRANPANSTASLPSWLRNGFTGHEHDEDLGLINMNGRIYDPATAHFLSTDPIVGNAMVGQTLNPYAYVNQNPLTLVDPSGFQTEGGGRGSGGGGGTGGSSGGTGWKPCPWFVWCKQPPPTPPGDRNSPGTTPGDSVDDSAPVAHRNVGMNTAGTTGRSHNESGAGGASGNPDDDIMQERPDKVQARIGYQDQLHIMSGAGDPRDNADDYWSGLRSRSTVGYWQGRVAAAMTFALASLRGGKSGDRGKGCPTCPCFVAGTQIQMADGTTRAIEDVKVGDWVLADNPLDQESPSAFRVTEAHVNSTLRVISIGVRGVDGQEGLIEATGEHPFWTQTNGWVAAAALSPGDMLIDAAGRTVEVITQSVKSQQLPTFNLTVEGVSTYFVVANGVSVLVHNQPRIHGVAPDWATKGAHVTASNGVEIAIRGGGPEPVYKPVFSRDVRTAAGRAAVADAIAEVREAMKGQAFRDRLLQRTQAATEMLGKGTPLERAGSGGTRALERTLKQMNCP